MAPFTWLITGANRGIGLTLVRQLLQDPSNIVLATCRAPKSASSLHDLNSSSLGNLSIFQLDVSEPASISQSVDSANAVLADRALDYLINNAGVGDRSESIFGTMTAEWLTHTLRVNTIGPTLVSKAYLPLLERPGGRGVVMNISSRLSAFSGDYGTYAPSYCMSKVALNMLTYKQAMEKPNLTFCAVSPGWVKTDMGGPGALITPDESASGLLRFIKGAGKVHSGKLFNFDGNPMSW